MAADGLTPDQRNAETATRWGPIALAVGAAVVVVVLLLIAFGNLLDPGAPSASASSAQEQSPSAEPTGAETPTASLSPTDAPAAGWTPVDVAGIPWVDGIAERDGRLVAVGRTDINGGRVVIAYSDDGVTWTPVDIANLGIGEIEPQGPNLVGLISLSILAGEPGFVALASRLTADFSVEDLYFFSSDGLDWQRADPPEGCAAGYGTRAVGSGFMKFGGVCIVEGATPPGPMRVVSSSDGRAWTFRLEEEMFASTWTTDGERIVMLDGCCGDPDRPDIAISDDLADTWRQVPDPFPAGVSVGTLAWGHDRYVAEASWLSNRPGDPNHAVCTSDTGEAWTCQALSSVTAPSEERRAVGAVTSTSTGFASLLMVLDDQFAQVFGLTAILATSTDGLSWTFSTVAAMKDAQLGGLLGTGHGVFAWGSTVNPDGSVQVPYVLVHLAPLP